MLFLQHDLTHYRYNTRKCRTFIGFLFYSHMSIGKTAMLARCVMQKTCFFFESALRCFPTETAISPPIPVSISSKIRLSIASVAEKIVFNASITRDISPPEAILLKGRKTEPSFAAIKNSILSCP